MLYSTYTIITLYAAIEIFFYNRTSRVELHLFADTRHGFSLGLGNNNSAYWVPMADAFFSRTGN